MTDTADKLTDNLHTNTDSVYSDPRVGEQRQSRQARDGAGHLLGYCTEY
jgi:hypothetical protein